MEIIESSHASQAVETEANAAGWITEGPPANWEVAVSATTPQFAPPHSIGFRSPPSPPAATSLALAVVPEHDRQSDGREIAPEIRNPVTRGFDSSEYATLTPLLRSAVRLRLPLQVHQPRFCRFARFAPLLRHRFGNRPPRVLSRPQRARLRPRTRLSTTHRRRRTRSSQTDAKRLRLFPFFSRFRPSPRQRRTRLPRHLHDPSHQRRTRPLPVDSPQTHLRRRLDLKSHRFPTYSSLFAPHPRHPV